MFLGQYTNCCQHPYWAGKDCTYHGQTSRHGAFFVVENKKGDIVAQSWVWEDKDGDVCFDNVEAEGIGEVRMPHVKAIYENVAKQMKGRIVTIGAHGDMDVKDYKHAPFEAHLRPDPSDYPNTQYRDSYVQKLLADNTGEE